MAWLSLVGGTPAGPRSLDWDDLASTPGPSDFLEQLFAGLCGASGLPSHVTDERLVPREVRVATGFCGTGAAGYRWVERECLQTSAVPYDFVVQTYGLPGVELHWHYCFDHAGQAGYAAFRHVSLRARFDSPEAERRFTDVWQRVFKTTPRWEAASEP